MLNVFTRLLYMSLQASPIICFVVLVRLIIQRFPKKYSYILWSVVAFRLVCPISFNSRISLLTLSPINSKQYIPSFSGVSANLSNMEAAPTYTASNETPYILSIAAVLWSLVFILLILHALIGYAKLSGKLKTATKYEDNIWQAECVTSPFIFGIFSPKIYIPYHVNSTNIALAIAHERYHISRGDHIVKLIAYLIVCLHWYNPLCWLSFALMCSDMEMSCDEKVLASTSSPKEYSLCLLSFAQAKTPWQYAPISFGENSVKLRLNNALNFHKTNIIYNIIAIAICVISLFVSAANPLTAIAFDKHDAKQVFDSLTEYSVATGISPAELYEEFSDECDVLFDNRDATLEYIYDEFFKGNVPEPQGMIMCEFLYRFSGLSLITDAQTGQEYFEDWLLFFVDMYHERGEEEIRKNFTPTWILLERAMKHPRYKLLFE